MSEDRKEQVERSKQLLQTVRHAAMATVNADGTPHNTPFFFMYDPFLTKVYWGSHSGSLHSQNVLRDGRIFVVVYDSFNQGKGGIYITANNAHEVPAKKLPGALKIHNGFRAKYGKEPLPITYYTEGEQRMYSAEIAKLEIYNPKRNANGQILRESRLQLDPKELLNES